MTETIDSFLAKIAICPLVPVLTIHDKAKAADIAVSLQDAGLTVAEVTLRTDDALDVIRLMKQAAPTLSVGAGTILGKQDIRMALNAGSDFLVTPATTTSLLAALQLVKVPVFPGVATPGEAMRAFEAGFRYQKYFPAESSGGVKALKSIAAPLPDIQFMPSGGVNASTVNDYLSCPNVVAVGGSWMVDKDAIARSDWDAVITHTKTAIKALSA